MTDYYVTYQETNPSSILDTYYQEGSPGPEEGLAVYVTGGFHPVSPGETYNDRYLIIRKLGFGSTSTVWLGDDKQYTPTLHS
jgi:hypothetical protein